MGSVPSSLMASRRQSKTTVQQICIDQHSGVVQQRRDQPMGAPIGMRQRLSSAMTMGQRVKIAAIGKSRRADTTSGKICQRKIGNSSQQQEEGEELILENLRKKLADSEKARMELEMRLRQMERTKMELVQELAKWIGGEQKMQMPNSVMQMPLDEEESQLGWKLEELLAQRLKERDEIWGKRMSEELAKRRRLMRAIEAKLGPEGLVELTNAIADGTEIHLNRGDCLIEVNVKKAQNKFGQATFSKRKSSNSAIIENGIQKCPNNDQQPTNDLLNKAELRIETPVRISSSTPPSRLSTASTIQTNKEEQQPQSNNGPIFRPSLHFRRQVMAIGGRGTVALDLEGICFDEENGQQTNGGQRKFELAEEFNEGGAEEEQEGEKIMQKMREQTVDTGEQPQRRASTSAKSRDSGISY